MRILFIVLYALRRVYYVSYTQFVPSADFHHHSSLVIHIPHRPPVRSWLA